MNKNLMPSLDLRFYLSSGSARKNDTCSRMRGRVDVDIPIHSRDGSSRLPPMYYLCDTIFKEAVFGFELIGKFQLLTIASSCMDIGEKEYNYSLSNAALFVGSLRIIDQRVQLQCVGSWKIWKASGEHGKLTL
jgi:hypothetical protein